MSLLRSVVRYLIRWPERQLRADALARASASSDGSRVGWSDALIVMLMLTVVVGVGLMVAILRVQASFTDATLSTIEKELQLRREFASFDAALQDLESSKRGYIITGNAATLTPYNAEATRLGGNIEWLTQQLAGQPTEEAAVRDLSVMLGQHILNMERALELARVDSGRAARALVASEAANGGTAAMIVLTRGMDERSLLRSNQAHVEIAERANRIQDAMAIVMVGTLAAFAALVANLRRSLRQQQAVARQLSAAKALAETANRAKSDFLASMSHELRTPLNAILGFSEVIRDRLMGGDLPSRYQDYAADIHRSGQHLLALVDDVLDLSKAAAGQMRLRFGAVDVAAAAEACRNMVGRAAEEAGVGLTVAITPDLPAIWADEQRFRQVLLNLLSNAVKFTPTGGQIRLAAERAGADVRLTVADTGIGIAPADLPYALVPFGRIDSHIARPGTGLGLSIVQEIVERHGGVLAITSALGVGTNVEVRLPLTSPAIPLPDTDTGPSPGLLDKGTAVVRLLSASGICLALFGAAPASAGDSAEVIHW